MERGTSLNRFSIASTSSMISDCGSRPEGPEAAASIPFTQPFHAGQDAHAPSSEGAVVPTVRSAPSWADGAREVARPGDCYGAQPPIG